MQLCLRFCFWILQSQISTVYGIRNLYCSASLSLISIGISTGLSYLLKPRNIQGELIQTADKGVIKESDLPKKEPEHQGEKNRDCSIKTENKILHFHKSFQKNDFCTKSTVHKVTTISQ